MNIPTVALIENMAYIRCPECKHEQPIFTSTYKMGSPFSPDGTESSEATGMNGNDCCHDKRLVGSRSVLSDLIAQFGVGTTLRLPLDPALSAMRFEDPVSGRVDFPFAKVFDDRNESWKKLKLFTQNLIRELSSITYGANL